MKNKNKGAITLEACVSVLSFLILMLLLSSLFVMFMAQNATAHAVLETSESLSLDVYSTERNSIDGGHTGTIEENIVSFLSGFFGRPSNDNSFTSTSKWDKGEDDTIEAAVRNRFIGYLAGGDEDEADEMLKNMNVVNGLSGLDFTDSYISGDTLYVVLKYELEYDFNIWNVGNVPVEQKACSKLWK